MHDSLLTFLAKMRHLEGQSVDIVEWLNVLATGETFQNSLILISSSQGRIMKLNTCS